MSKGGTIFGQPLGQISLPAYVFRSAFATTTKAAGSASSQHSQTILERMLVWWLGAQNRPAEPTFIAARNPDMLNKFKQRPLLQRVTPDSFWQ